MGGNHGSPHAPLLLRSPRLTLVRASRAGKLPLGGQGIEARVAHAERRRRGLRAGRCRDSCPAATWATPRFRGRPAVFAARRVRPQRKVWGCDERAGRSSRRRSSGSRTIGVVVLDQRRLPDEEVELSLRTAAEVADAIRTLAVRGAPAIGVAAAYGYALAARRGDDLDAAAAVLVGVAADGRQPRLGARADAGRSQSYERARALHADEVDRCRRMAEHASALFAPGTRALTHCNAGGLATGGYGTRGRRAAPGVGARPRPPRLGRRDAAAAPGQPADGVGARPARHPARGDRGLGGGVADGGRRGRLRRHRRRPHRRERRHGEQDRDVRAGGPRGAPRHPALRRRADLDRRSRARRPVRRSRSRSATARSCRRRFPARNPAFDVTPAALIAAIVTEEGRPSRARTRSRCRARRRWNDRHEVGTFAGAAHLG